MLTIFDDMKDFWKELFSNELNNVQDYIWFTKGLLLVLGATILALLAVVVMAIVYSVLIVVCFVCALIDYKSLRKAAHYTLKFAERAAEDINKMWENRDK